MKIKIILIIFIVSFLFFGKTFAGVFFSELFPNTTNDSNLEYIEIYNSGSIDLNLEGYFIKDKSGKQFDFGYGSYISSFSKKKIFRSESKILLNNTNEDLFLYDNIGNLIDSFSYSTSTKGIKLIILNNNNNNNNNSGTTIDYSNFDLKYNFQNPSYIVDKEIIKNKYICDNTKDECKINLDLTSSFSNIYKESNFNCEIDFGLNGWKNGEENKCNPATFIYPKGVFNLKMKIISKSNSNIFFEKTITIENNINAKIIEVEKIIEKEVCNKSSSHSSSSGYNTTSVKNIKKINISKPNIIIQSGIIGGKCTKEDCNINLNYEVENKNERCLWNFGSGVFKTVGTEKKCNPGYVKYGMGNHKVKLKVYQKGLETNFNESVLEFVNSKNKNSPIIPFIKGDEDKNNGDIKVGLSIYGVMPNPKGSDSLEYVELINNTDYDINLKGCILDDIIDGGSKKFIFEDDFILEKYKKEKVFKEFSNLNFNNNIDEVNLICDGKILDNLSWDFNVKENYFLTHNNLNINSQEAFVVDVIDGDTIKIKFKGKNKIEKLRLLGINTPELRGNSEYGLKAKNYTLNNLKGKTVFIEIDSSNYRDLYSRLLGYVILDGENFNKKLVREGFTKVYLNYNFEYKNDFFKAEKLAKTEKKGIWYKDIEIIYKDNVIEEVDENNNIVENEDSPITPFIKGDEDIALGNIKKNETYPPLGTSLKKGRRISREVKKIKGVIKLSGKIGSNKILKGYTLTCFETCSVNFAGVDGGDKIKQYVWDFGNGKIFKGKNPPYIKYEEYGDYKVVLSMIGEKNIEYKQDFFVNYVGIKKQVKKSKKKVKTTKIKNKNYKNSKISKVEIKNKEEICEKSIDNNKEIYGYILSFLIMIIISLMGIILLQKRKLI